MDIDAIENTTRQSRDDEQHDKNARRKPWQPARMLETPPAPEGYQYRWIRSEYVGVEDRNNVSARMREGWEFVRAEEIKNQLGDNDYPVISEGKYQGLIGVGGLVLARIPEEIIEQRKKYFSNITSDQMKAVDNDILREQRPDMPVNVDRQSRVTFGGGRKS